MIGVDRSMLDPPGALPSSFQSNAVADNEPVEAGLMLSEMSTRGGLPIYGRGGVQHDEGGTYDSVQYGGVMTEIKTPHFILLYDGITCITHV